MTRPSFATRWNADVIDAQYQRWRGDPLSVDDAWRLFFEGFELGQARSPGAPTAVAPPLPSGEKGAQVATVRLIDAYRHLGHLIARLDPLSQPLSFHPLLDLSEFGLSEADLDKTFDTSPFVGLPSATLRQLLAALKETYCRTIGVEYMHIQDTRIRHWLQERMEPRRNEPRLQKRQKLRTLLELHFAELFEKFLQTKYVGQKRFSLEGSETLLPLLDAIVEKAADGGVREIVLGMSHRGRLNVLVNTIGKPYEEVFHEFEDDFLPNSMDGDGDVKYHLGFAADRVSARGNKIHLSLSPNPSHLEAVDPVVEGRTRAKQFHFGDVERSLGIPLLIHGDAAFAGQGLVAETLNLSQLQGYRTGGTIHVIINNQIGFTTAPVDARSTLYCTDVAKMIEVPIFHVNGEDPEAAVYVAELALDFRQTFHKDVVIDMYCYRRHGHNEGDEPSFTQPVMYAKIKDWPSLTEVYTEQLIMRGNLSVEETEGITVEFQEKLHAAVEEVKTGPKRTGMKGYGGRWSGLSQAFSHAPVDTGVSHEALLRVVQAMSTVPEGFAVHPKITRLLESRVQEVKERKTIDWALAEGLAFGTLLLEGCSVRLSGQDSRRGTFSQRHAVLYDYRTGDPYFPLKALATPRPAGERGKGEGTRVEADSFTVWDSLLSEAAVLGFEFGYALDMPDALVLWEAQFGDFVNGAQVIIDQFIACSASKWQRDCGLVLLLPHGYEGQGPEHSSARLERFLQLCGEENMQVCYPTTPAQYFHVLRRQMKRNFRKPLVLMTPKSLLRHKACVSPVAALISNPRSAGQVARGEGLCRFQEVLDDGSADPVEVRRVVLCSGKVYYDLLEKRGDVREIAIVRLEQFYPFPAQTLERTLARYSRAKEWFWVQEESLNMGGWSFVEPRLRTLGWQLKYVGRDTSASPATGSRQVHLREQRELVEAAMRSTGPHLVRSTTDGQAKPKSGDSVILRPGAGVGR